MKACHLNFILHWKSIFLEQGKHINNAAVPAEGNSWFVKSILTVRVQEMESQQDKPHLQAPAKMAFSKPENNLQTDHSLHFGSTLNTCSKCPVWREIHCNYRDSATCAGQATKRPLWVFQSF